MGIEDLINKVTCEDCLEVLKTLPDKSIDLIVTDPPYGIDIGCMNFTQSIKGGVAIRNDYSNHNLEWDKNGLTKEQIEQIFRVSKNQIIFGVNHFANMLPNTRGWVIWDKRCEDKYSNDFADCELIWTSFDKPAKIIRFLWSGMLQGDMKNKEKRYHPTQKPLFVMKELIKMFSKEEDIILDCFLGSGSTAVAAKQLGRRYIGIEKDPNYCKIAEQRLKSLPERLDKFATNNAVSPL